MGLQSVLLAGKKYLSLFRDTAEAREQASVESGLYSNELTIISPQADP